MMQEIDQDYIRAIVELPDGIERLDRWIGALIEERETAEQIAKACVAQLKPLRARVDELLAANTGEVERRQAIVAELQGQLAELEARVFWLGADAGGQPATIPFTADQLDECEAALTRLQAIAEQDAEEPAEFEEAHEETAAAKGCEDGEGLVLKDCGAADGERALPEVASPSPDATDRLEQTRKAAERMAEDRPARVPPRKKANRRPARASEKRAAANPAPAPVARQGYIAPQDRFAVLARATAFLKARCVLVTPVDRDAVIRKYRVSGKRDAMLLSEVINYAIEQGFELEAQG